ncbi:MAG: malate dehydrogenase, partial [Flavobacteriia bacterium]|nr:malate dehydrogenase [Flavobacteriia bacterium]
MKITVVGAGNVGATVAENMVRRELAEEIVLLDIKEGFAEGKAMDMNQCATLNGYDSKVVGSTNDYSKTAGSKVAVITSGIPRKPGMTREELIGTNAKIVQTVTENLIKHSPDIIIVVISNPMDTMTYLTSKTSGLPKNRIIGMGGILDSARFKYRLAEQLGCSPNDLQGQVIGGHGDTTMIPLIKHATYNSMPVTQFLTEEQQEYVVKETMVGGATLTGLIGTSAWYAPGAAVSSMVQAIACDQKKVFPCSVMLDGQYGFEDICLGVPVVIGKNGIEQIIEIELSSEEKTK